MSLTIRRAEPGDVPMLLELVRDLATYEREPDAVVATEADMLREGFGAAPSFHVFVAEWEREREPIGFALYFFTYSTWRGRRCLYLEDLFVRPEHRGRGAGLALMRRLAREALDQGCARFAWQVLDWNEPSIAFYEKLGARIERQWLSVRIDGDTLAALAARAASA